MISNESDEKIDVNASTGRYIRSRTPNFSCQKISHIGTAIYVSAKLQVLSIPSPCHKQSVHVFMDNRAWRTGLATRLDVGFTEVRSH